MNHDCDVYEDTLKVEHPANATDWSHPGSQQGYQVWRCEHCGDYWGERYQWDAGTGHDDRWKRFGQVDPATIQRHY